MKKSDITVLAEDERLTTLIAKSNQQVLGVWAADCAERVLPYFRKNFPDDRRPQEAVNAVRAWARGALRMSKARKAAFASHTAAREADGIAANAVAAARAAGHAAATAHVPTHAIYAASYALKSIIDEVKWTNEREWQYQRLLELNSVDKSTAELES